MDICCMIAHPAIDNRQLLKLIKQKKLSFGGNVRLKIYGTLSCRSGKRMLRQNRVFFASAEEATRHGYRPCAHCMKAAYNNWKNELIR